MTQKKAHRGKGTKEQSRITAITDRGYIVAEFLELAAPARLFIFQPC